MSNWHMKMKQIVFHKLICLLYSSEPFLQLLISQKSSQLWSIILKIRQVNYEKVKGII